MAALTPVPKIQFFDANGHPLAGGKLYSYSAGTTTPLVTYTDQAGTSANTNPVILDARGEASVWLGTGPYKLRLTTATDVDIWTVDDIYSEGALSMQELLSSAGSSLVGFIQSGTGATYRTVQSKLRDTVSVKDFGAVGDGVANDTAAMQAAADYAWNNGKQLFIPAGTYKAKLTLPPAGTTEPRGDAFIMQGEGAGSVFLGGAPYIKGTTIISPDTSPAFNLTNVLTAADAGPQVHIRDIRFEATSTNPVVQFATWNDFCEMRNCEVRQDGTGGGINMIRAYGGTIRDTHVVNNNLIGTGSYTGTGVNVGTPYSGALLTFQKVSVRGFNTGFNLGSGGGTYILNTTLQQCECAWNNYGIIVNAGMRKTVINECYFEEVQTVGVQDEGEGTTISNCLMFEGCTTQIKGDYDTRGNLYFGNYIQLGGPNETGIAIKGSSDATGYAKTVRDNFIYFLNSGGTVAGVVGIALTGTAPAINFDSNQFRPRRAWVGGAGTSKFTNSATGKITGMVPATDSLNEFPVASNYSISFPASSSPLTQADVSSGVLSLPAASSRIGLSASSAVNVTSISLTGQNERMIVFVFNNTNMTFVKGAQMLMASNFSGPGTLFCDVRNESGTVYLYELGRTVF